MSSFLPSVPEAEETDQSVDSTESHNNNKSALPGKDYQLASDLDIAVTATTITMEIPSSPPHQEQSYLLGGDSPCGNGLDPPSVSGCDGDGNAVDCLPRGKLSPESNLGVAVEPASQLRLTATSTLAHVRFANGEPGGDDTETSEASKGTRTNIETGTEDCSELEAIQDAATTRHSVKMDAEHDGDGEASGSVLSSSAVPINGIHGIDCPREPEGARPKHRIGESQHFTDRLSAQIQEDVGVGNENGSMGVDMSTIEDTLRSTSISPPDGLREIDVWAAPEDTSEIGQDEISAPPQPTQPVSVSFAAALSPPAVATPGAPVKMRASDIDDGVDDQSLQLNIPYRTDAQPLPPESDLSVFSIHSGYGGMVDQNAIPQIVPGTMVHSSPAMHQAPYPAIPTQIMPSAMAPPLPSRHSSGAGSYIHYQHSHHPQHQYAAPSPMPPHVIMGPPSMGKRKVHFRLVEEVEAPTNSRGYSMRSSFLSFRRPSSGRNLMTASPVAEEPPQHMDRGRVTVSWYEGTTSLELLEHVRTTVTRKLGIESTTTKLHDIRILDEGSNPPEEIVLSPYIPSGSQLVLRFSTRDAAGDMTPPHYDPSYTGAPESPSAAPSPYTRSSVDLQGLGLNANQLALLGTRLKGLQVPPLSDNVPNPGASATPSILKGSLKKSTRVVEPRRSKSEKAPSKSNGISNGAESPSRGSAMKDTDDLQSKDDQSSVFEMQSLHPDDPIQQSLQNITELLMRDRQQQQRAAYGPKRQDKRQVVFVLANYFVLFLSLIAISAEIQARAPAWNASIEVHLNNVKNCSKDQEALFECVSNGDMAGLVASVVLWISRSAATKRIFLFGFDSPRKLWAVVYESMVTAVCWGFSYMFIRRGMNPDTNRNFLQKYWKDAIYGSLAGFNAAFLKHVLKNLIPQEAIEDALQERQLKILSWLPSFA